MEKLIFKDTTELVHKIVDILNFTVISDGIQINKVDVLAKYDVVDDLLKYIVTHYEVLLCDNGFISKKHYDGTFKLSLCDNNVLNIVEIVDTNQVYDSECMLVHSDVNSKYIIKDQNEKDDRYGRSSMIEFEIK